MAIYDASEANRNKAQKEKFEELKKFITAQDGNGKFSDWYLAFMYINDMENTIKKQAEKINEYRDWFAKLQSFLPHVPSIYDPIY